MSSKEFDEPKTESHHGHSEVVEAEARVSHDNHDHAYDLDEKAKASDYKADAILAENAEHNMGVLEAVRAYPMATFWAFIMSFTIVSYLFHFSTWVFVR